jgi:hypothetical protein
MENILTKNVWDLEHSSKIDVLEEPAHSHLILKFLIDAETGIEKEPDSTYILYGGSEALLVIPTRPATKLLLFWCYVIKKLSRFQYSTYQD